MNPAPFEYHRATTLAEAHDLLGRLGDEAKVLAGGHSLLPTMKLRLAQPAHLIDIGGIGALRYVESDGATLRIGALTTHHDIETNATVRQVCPLLAEVAAVIGDRQVRNRGTIGGALAHADPAEDYPAAVRSLGRDAHFPELVRRLERLPGFRCPGPIGPGRRTADFRRSPFGPEASGPGPADTSSQVPGDW